MTQVIDLDHLRSWIGREETSDNTVTSELVRRFCATMDLPGDGASEGTVAPPLVHFCFSSGAPPTAELGEDGHPRRGTFLPPVPLPRRMWAGSDIRLVRPIRVGDTLRRTSRVSDVAVKEGQTGALCFVTVAHRIEVEEQAGVEETQTIVYRGPDGTSGGDRLSAPVGQWRRDLKLEAPFLFRYSAVTFNSHRIHYDRRYVTDVEPYPGLVVHGPLQATLLMNYAVEIRGSVPTRFRFRSSSPLFDVDAASMNAVETETGLKLWTAREGGPVAMSAEADW